MYFNFIHTGSLISFTPVHSSQTSNLYIKVQHHVCSYHCNKYKISIFYNHLVTKCFLIHICRGEGVGDSVKRYYILAKNCGLFSCHFSLMSRNVISRGVYLCTVHTSWSYNENYIMLEVTCTI